MTPPSPSPTPRALFLAFLGVGLSGFGGVLPFARRMLVERTGWMDEAAFVDTLALCQYLPGPNVVNLSVAVGARFAGVKGAAAAFTGLVGAPVAVVLALAALYDRFGAVGRAPDMILGLGAAAAGLVAATAVKMARPILGRRPATALPVTALVVASVAGLRLPLVLVLGALAPVSLGLEWARRRAARR